MVKQVKPVSQYRLTVISVSAQFSFCRRFSMFENEGYFLFLRLDLNLKALIKFYLCPHIFCYAHIISYVYISWLSKYQLPVHLKGHSICLKQRVENDAWYNQYPKTSLALWRGRCLLILFLCLCRVVFSNLDLHNKCIYTKNVAFATGFQLRDRHHFYFS